MRGSVEPISEVEKGPARPLRSGRQERWRFQWPLEGELPIHDFLKMPPPPALPGTSIFTKPLGNSWHWKTLRKPARLLSLNREH